MHGLASGKHGTPSIASSGMHISEYIVNCLKGHAWGIAGTT